MAKVSGKEYLSIKLASPETIKSWSFGEVKKSETVNYRTFKPEKDGLFCERIFGPTKNYQCGVGCGKYKKERDVGTICEECGVEVQHSRVRRERMGHIELATPIVHFWYFKKQNYIQLLLNMKQKDVESVIYCKNYIVLDAGNTQLQKKQVVTDKQYAELYEKYGESFRVDIGGRAIKELLAEINLDKMAEELKKELEETKTLKAKDIAKRLKLVEDFRKSGNRPEWMVMDMVPILPADLRPLVQLDGGRFATSDLNELYRRIINRNNRLKRLKELGAPSIIEENELRMLQAAVDSLIANQNRQHPVTGPGKRVLKSLSSYLEGKAGRFRQNLLGKRVDYSGRSVIVVGPELKLHQCGIPREMALELFKPFVMNQMKELGYVETFKQAKRQIENRNDKMWDVLEKIVQHHPVLLNRAPTLHKLSIRAFEPVIIEGKAIQLHPLVCSGFNADFDGDTMSVHIPISREAQAEARILLLATKNLLHPQNGKSSVTPSQDMVLGCYYLSIEEEGAKGEGKFFASIRDVYSSLENKYITYHTKIILNVENDDRFDGKYIVTTPGKIIFNEDLPEGIPFVNNGLVNLTETEGVFDNIEETLDYLKNKKVKNFDKGFLEEFVSQVYNEIGEEKTAILLDNIKEKGFVYSTKAGLTISLADVVVPGHKWDIIKEAESDMVEIEELYQYGRISKDDRHEFVINKWSKISAKVADASIDTLDGGGFNPIKMMIDSGARGSKNQYRQLAAMRGLMADPSGKTIERAILKNFKEGLDPFDYFISSHGARKGQADTSLKTADSGYLTRRLVDVAHDVVVNEDDCKTESYILVRDIEPRVEKLEERILGRRLGKDLILNGKVLFEKDALINKQQAKEIAELFEEVPIRSLLTCESVQGVCKKCYGYDLSTNREVPRGEAVGVIAAQSIGEPGTQLTMRTFHSGGVAGNDITQGLPRIQEIFEARKKIKGEAILSEFSGTVSILEKGRLKDIKIVTEEGKEQVYHVSLGVGIEVENGMKVVPGQQLTKGSINAHKLLELRGIEPVQEYLLQEVQRVYRGQGVKINDKHIEVIIRQMTKQVQIFNPGDSDEVMGSILNKGYVERKNKQLRNEEKQVIEFIPVLMGITTASLSTESFLSAASFQETPSVLTEAAVKGKVDKIVGLKEAVILGRNIPAGTGFPEYSEE
ncbi:DNA-directed RNA polymerase subunit beta' [Bacillus thuringiensis]|uniref:DNA-directed RNA polymerase subunit beta' n=1 Tax=Bacillus thuringiensis TaxID=1428 RepID=UPI0021D69298|nr:DNA-directed RNA polymerase subunit beta' [Bacillus thuringiensis]MCU7667052.1 DNA-directed RNA polymerase subunit beta' [Bacillus thuringiensis]